MTKNSFLLLNRIFLVLAIFVLCYSCQKDTVTSPPTATSVQFLGHKGSGNSSLNPAFVENTLTGIQKGLTTLSGVEVDLQMSLDGTIWLYHNMDLSNSSCKAISGKTIILSRDNEISALNICTSRTQDRIYKLTELLTIWNQSSNPYYISLHIKLDYPVDSLNKPVIGGEAMYLAKFADNLAKVLPSVKSPGKIIVEVYDDTFCKRVHQLIPGIKVCMQKEVSFPKQIDDALALGYDGVSCIFNETTLTEAEVTRAQKNGLIVELWTPNSKEELTKSIQLHPNTIQTDNLNALSDLNVTVK